MSCVVCAGYLTYNCPVCGGGVTMVECKDCEDGMEYWAFNIKTRNFVRVTALAYQILPFDEDDAENDGKVYCQGEIRPCATCHGECEIPQ